MDELDHEDHERRPMKYFTRDRLIIDKLLKEKMLIVDYKPIGCYMEIKEGYKYAR
jgi:hypothetical protein